MENNQSWAQEQRAEYIRREEAFQKAYPDGFRGVQDEIEAMKQYGLYCGTCRHGNGCVHGVPYGDAQEDVLPVATTDEF